MKRPDETRLGAARATADAHGWGRVAGQYFDLYDTLAARMAGQLSHVARVPDMIQQTGERRAGVMTVARTGD